MESYQYDLQLSDFGLSKAGDNSMETFCGTQSYMAPELWSDARHYCSKVDIWALGAILFTCLCGYPPFSTDYTDFSLKEQIMKGIIMKVFIYLFDYFITKLI